MNPEGTEGAQGASPEATAFAKRILALPEWADPTNHERLLAGALDAAHLAAVSAAMELPSNGLTFVEHSRVSALNVPVDTYVPIAYDAQITGYGFGPVMLQGGRKQDSVVLTLNMALPSDWFTVRASRIATMGRPPNPIPGAVPLVSSRLILPRSCLSLLGLASVRA